ncbi:hypothetical protein Tco_1053891 [Tanacetum coccineum]|uniref:Uncharacterized protein n=1 Tax=Tanacetum coccineum TaxID=301880 RepID=A0ABQ5GW59_9ASTR
MAPSRRAKHCKEYFVPLCRTWCKRRCEASPPVKGALVTSGFELSSRNTMPKSIYLDHHDTAHYISMYHRTRGFTKHEKEVYKSLVSRLIYEGRVIDSTFLDDQPNLRPTFAAIRTQPKSQKMKGIDTFLDPFQMIVSELKIDLKKWEIVLGVNADKGKRPRLPTPSPSNFESSDSPSPTPHQRMENDPVNNYTLDLIPYMNQLPPIEGGEFPEFKQTKGLFKCLFYFLSKKK